LERKCETKVGAGGKGGKENERSLARCGGDNFGATRHLLYFLFSMTRTILKANRDTKRDNKLGRAGKSALLKHVAQAALPSRFGRFTIHGFAGNGALEEAVALVRGNLKGRSAPLVRIHSQCLTGDVLASLRCDCRAQLELSLKKMRHFAVPAAGRTRHRIDE
jgi:hypothetical protein